MELREEPRRFIGSTESSTYPTKTMGFGSEEDEPPAYISDPSLRTRDQNARTRLVRDGSWRNFNGSPSAYSPPPTRSRDHNSNSLATAEAPLRPNRRADSEFGREDPPSASRVLLPISANSRPRRSKSSGKNSATNWLKNIKSPIGEFSCASAHA